MYFACEKDISMVANCEPTASLSIIISYSSLVLIQIIWYIVIFVCIRFILQAYSTFLNNLSSDFSSETFMGSRPLSPLSNLSIRSETHRNWKKSS